MKCLHLTPLAFCHVLLASAVLYLNIFAAASPLAEPAKQQPPGGPQPAAGPSTVLVESLRVAQEERAAKAAVAGAPVSGKSSPIVESPVQKQAQVAEQQQQQQPAPRGQLPVLAGAGEQPAAVKQYAVVQSPAQPPEVVAPAKQPGAIQKEPLAGVRAKSAAVVEQPASPAATAVAPGAPVAPQVHKASEDQVAAARRDQISPSLPQPAAYHADSRRAPQPAAESFVKSEPLIAGASAESRPLTGRKQQQQAAEPKGEQQEPTGRAKVVEVAPQSVASAPASGQQQTETPIQRPVQAVAALPPLVKGGLGPLHLLATTLCSYQPDRPVADECLNQLYARRAHLRKSLFEFMSLKFTNLEKLSSRLGYGLQVVPVKSVAIGGAAPGPARASGQLVAPSHGWPVVGKCTAHDLKLMGEAAWCEAEPAAAATVALAQPIAVGQEAPVAAVVAPLPAQVGGLLAPDNQQAPAGRDKQARAARQAGPPAAPAEQSSVISKLLHVGDVKEAPLVESTIYNLNLTQQQLATLEAHATSTRECRRNALRYTKALFNHLAEDQRNASDSWPQLYALIQADDCARKRLIDIVTALSGFRTDTTSIRRDNLEFAFAMDDLRTKVLDNEVNVPLTFDKQFIEVEQFLQQSVRLMLSNIDPSRAKLTSMRYRSLMYGNSGGAADDQCIELHQRLLAQSYPTDCNPNQFGQLPDVLRMTASSLELWSVEKEIGLHTARGGTFDYPNTNSAGQQKVRENVNECIASLVSS